MKRLAVATITLGLTFGGLSTPAWAKTTATIPTLRSPAGNLYRAGEFCPKRDIGVLDHGSDGVIKCVVDAGYDRWVKT